MEPGITLIKNLLSTPGTGKRSNGTAPAPKIIDKPLPDALQQRDLFALYSFWESKKDTLGRLPGRRDFSPLELKKLLPHIALLDVTRGHKGMEFRFRLCGTQVAECCGADLTGISWSDADVPDAVMGRTHDLVQHKVPYHSTNVRAVWAPKDFQHYSVLALPLASDGETVDMILYGFIFHPMEEKLP